MYTAVRLSSALRLFGLLALAVPLLSAAEPSLLVSFGSQSKELGAADLAKLPAAEADVTDHGTTHHYRGVAVRDVLALVGAPTDRQIRGAALALVVKVRASDGYVVAFALAEFDPNFREHAILLADREDGAPLPEKSGPLRIVCPGDKRGARSVHHVISLEVISVAPEGRVKS